MNFMSLNIRGISEPEKAAWVRRLKKEVKFSFLAIQESHQAGLSEFQLSRFWDRDEMKSACLDSEGRSGGVFSVWDPSIFSVDSVIKGNGLLLTSGNMPNIEERVNVMNIYAPREVVNRRLLWEDILQIMDNFNEVRNPEERL